MSPAPKAKPARKRKAPPKPAPVVVDEGAEAAEEAPKPKRTRAKKAAPAAEEAPADEAGSWPRSPSPRSPWPRRRAEDARGRARRAGRRPPRTPTRRTSPSVTSIRDDIRRVIVRPVISEKSFQLVQAHNQYTFRVLDGAHKTEIRQAIEDLFDVTVTDVRTVSVQSKPKRRGASRGRRPGWKKAIVELRPGDKIELFEGA